MFGDFGGRQDVTSNKKGTVANGAFGVLELV